MNQYRSVVVADHYKTVIDCRILDTRTGETGRKWSRGPSALLTRLLGPRCAAAVTVRLPRLDHT